MGIGFDGKTVTIQIKGALSVLIAGFHHEHFMNQPISLSV